MAKLFERLSELRDLINEAEKEPSMKPYWMVHRYGRKSGVPQKVHTSFESAYNEAVRLTRKERDRFVILEAHTLIEPFEPLVITVETVGNPPAMNVSDHPQPGELGYRCECICDPDSDEVSILCEALDGEHYTSPESCPADESGRMDDCTCSPRVAVTDTLECDEPNAPLPKAPCPCGCDNQGDPSTINPRLLTLRAKDFESSYQSGCMCGLCAGARDKAMDLLRLPTAGHSE